MRDRVFISLSFETPGAEFQFVKVSYAYRGFTRLECWKGDGRVLYEEFKSVYFCGAGKVGNGKDGVGMQMGGEKMMAVRYNKIEMKCNQQ